MFVTINLKPRSLRTTPHPLFGSVTHPYINSYLDKSGRKKKKKKTVTCLNLKESPCQWWLEEFSCHSKRVLVLLGNPALVTSKLPGTSHHLQHRKPDRNASSWIQQKVLCCVVQGEENNQSKWHEWWTNLRTQGHAISPLCSAQVKKRSYKNSSN